MKPKKTVISASYLKAHVSEVIRDAADNQKTFVSTHRGEAKAIIYDVRIYEQLQKSLALLKILAQSRKSVEAGNVSPVEEVFGNLRRRFRGRRFKKN